MRIFALELNNDRKGLEVRKPYIEALLARLPELALCGYMASREIWQYADRDGQDTARWARDMAEKYNTCIGVGYLELENGDYYNRYLVADKHQVFGVVTKSEGEAAVFKRGDFGNLIKTPFGNIAAGICYDAKRRHLYENIQDQEISLIVFPHGCPADPEKAEEEIEGNDFFCGQYQSAFQVPVVYVNSVGGLGVHAGRDGCADAKSGVCHERKIQDLRRDKGHFLPGQGSSGDRNGAGPPAKGTGHPLFRGGSHTGKLAVPPFGTTTRREMGNPRLRDRQAGPVALFLLPQPLQADHQQAGP